MRQLLAVILTAIVLLTFQALAHEWYPNICCGDQDCHPVPCDQLVEDKAGWLYLPTGNHFEGTQVKPSQDRFCHVCLGVSDKRSLCAFVLSGA